MKGSLVRFHPTETDGKVAHLCAGPKFDDPSRRSVNSAM